MAVTFAGISMEDKPVPRNAESPMISGSVDPETKSMLPRLSLELNAHWPMLLTLAGIVTDIRPFAPLNANSPISSTPLGTMALPVQPSFPTTTLSSIVKVPAPDTDPSVTQLTFSTTAALTGLNTKPESANASDVTRMEIRRIGFSLSTS